MPVRCYCAVCDAQRCSVVEKGRVEILGKEGGRKGRREGGRCGPGEEDQGLLLRACSCGALYRGIKLETVDQTVRILMLALELPSFLDFGFADYAWPGNGICICYE